jgi:hypothetical protein
MVPGRIAGEIDARRALLRSPAGRVLAAGLGALALVTIIGMAILCRAASAGNCARLTSSRSGSSRRP